MPDPRGHGGPPWGGPGWNGPGFGPGRRFRRGAFIFLSILILLVAALATVVASVITGNTPPFGIAIAASVVVLVGLVMSARWLWRNARTIGSLMDAADRVAGGDLGTRVPESDARQLGRLTSAFNEMAERLETNEQRRRELLADIAHELRTPLQVIRGSVEGMLDGLYPVDAERLQPLLEETVVMARLLDDLRTLSMAEAGVLELHRETVDPDALAAETVQAFMPMAEEAGISLTAERDDAPTTIEADPVRVAEILTNLIANALRHTPSGGRVTVRIEPAPGGGATFTVRDTGPGIERALLPFVFDRFTTSSGADGTGLGLAIAKRLVEAHGGTIEATSPAGGGTTIRLVIPEDLT
jgi:signal transduction histidine kinase